MKIYTRRGDDGSTALGSGERLRKDSSLPEAYGAVDEAQTVLGLVRAEAEDELAGLVEAIQRDLWRVMGELANRSRRVDGVTSDMVAWLEAQIDSLGERFEMPTEFVIPGQTRTAALLDLARTVVRRAERRALTSGAEGAVMAYLNRLSDLLWVMARWQEGESLPSRRCCSCPTHSRSTWTSSSPTRLAVTTCTSRAARRWAGACWAAASGATLSCAAA